MKKTVFQIDFGAYLMEVHRNSSFYLPPTLRIYARSLKAPTNYERSSKNVTKNVPKIHVPELANESRRRNPEFSARTGKHLLHSGQDARSQSSCKPRPTYPSAHAPEPTPARTQLEPPPEVQQFQPQPQVRVELIRVYDEPDPASVEAQPPVEPTPQPAAAIAEPTAQPVPSEPPPNHKKKYKKRPRRKARRNIEEEFALVQKGILTPVGHHERLCLVCRSPLRENIEEEFVHWHNVHDIATHYGIEARTIYRYAKALNLYDERDRNLRFALGHIIHRPERPYNC